MFVANSGNTVSLGRRVPHIFRGDIPSGCSRRRSGHPEMFIHACSSLDISSGMRADLQS